MAYSIDYLDDTSTANRLYLQIDHLVQAASTRENFTVAQFGQVRYLKEDDWTSNVSIVFGDAREPSRISVNMDTLAASITITHVEQQDEESEDGSEDLDGDEGDSFFEPESDDDDLYPDEPNSDDDFPEDSDGQDLIINSRYFDGTSLYPSFPVSFVEDPCSSSFT